MVSKIKKISKKPFIRNTFIVATGTAAAQIITFAFIPIITRIYGPEAFGVLGVFMAIVAIISPIAALTYPIAIVLPKSDTHAKSLIRVSLYSAGIMTLFVTIVLLLFSKQIVSLLQIKVILPYLYLFPLIIIFSALLQVCQQWLIRKQQFRITANVAFLNALFLNSAKTGIGLINPVATVLVILTTLSNVSHALMLYLGARKHQNKKMSKPRKEEKLTLREIAKKYIDFPLFRAPQTLVNAISQNLPVLLLSSLFGPIFAGFYSLARSVLGKPIQLIGKSVGDVFYPKIAEAANNGKNISKLITKATLALAAVGIVPFGLIIVFGPWLFGLIFGLEWELAGEYASWLAIGFFGGFINRPSAMAIPVLKLQGQFLIYEIASGVIRIGIMFISYLAFQEAIYVIASFSLASFAVNVFLIGYTIRKAKLV